MNSPVTRLLLILLAVLAPACQPKAYAAGSPLRFDGLYCCNVPTNVGVTTSCLRFYPDGTVLAVISLGSPSDVAKWFTRQKEPNFRYTLKDHSLRFKQSGSPLSYLYSGTITGDSLALRVDGYKGSKSMGYVERTYKFVPIALH